MSDSPGPVDHKQEALDTLATARGIYDGRSDTPNAMVELIADQIPAVVHALLYVGDQIAAQRAEPVREPGSGERPVEGATGAGDA
ncbi:hypothetical protein [Nonomuraea guangzhouensis]|uniref:Uncharacterized protein n=1 Tax=Nonomuraea guangzhouensis TaxID=1291555 RepID=A0ABW4GNA2_9ACTN|nr:hypothetical protein [Nonomuraea guangzhouensis]